MMRTWVLLVAALLPACAGARICAPSTTTTIPCIQGVYTYQEGATGCGNTNCGFATPDVYLSQDAPTMNFDGGGLIVGATGGEAFHTLLQFDISDLPTSIQSATLDLDVLTVTGTPGAGRLCRLRQVSWQDGYSTWNFYLTSFTPWEVAGALGTTEDIESPGSGDTACVAFSGFDTPGHHTIDVTGLVTDAVTVERHPTRLRVWLTQDDESGSDSFLAADAEDATLDNRPLLTVGVCGGVPTTSSTSTSTSTTSTSSSTTSSTSSSTSSTSSSTSTSSTSSTGATTSSTSTSTSSTSTSSSTTSSTSSSTTTTTSGGTTTTSGSVVADNFDRGSLPTSGGNWTTQVAAFGGTTAIIVGSDALSVSSGDFSANALWTTSGPVATAGYVCAQFSGQGAGETGVCIGMDTSGNAVCCSSWDDGAGGEYWNMSKYIGGAFTEFVEFDTTPHFVAGDYIGIQRTSATAFRCYRSTSGTSWTAIGTGSTIASIPDPGVGGTVTNNDGDVRTPFMLDVWEWGDGTLPTGHTCGAP